MAGQFSEEDIKRIVRTVLRVEKTVIADLVRQEIRTNKNFPWFSIIRGTAVTTVSASDTTFEIENIHSLGQGAPLPFAPVKVVNVPGLSFSQGDTVHAIFHYAVMASGTNDSGTGTGDGNWEVLAVGGSSGGGNAAKVILTDFVPGYSSISGTEFTCFPGMLGLIGSGTMQTGGGVLVEWGSIPENTKLIPLTESVDIGTATGTDWRYQRVVIVNASRTDIRASVQSPVLGFGVLESVAVWGTGTDEGTGTEGTGTTVALERRFIVHNIMDFRALPGLLEGVDAIGTEFGTGTGTPQIPYHTGDGSFRLGGEVCGTPGTGT